MFVRHKLVLKWMRMRSTRSKTDTNMGFKSTHLCATDAAAAASAATAAAAAAATDNRQHDHRVGCLGRRVPRGRASHRVVRPAPRCIRSGRRRVPHPRHRAPHGVCVCVCVCVCLPPPSLWAIFSPTVSFVSLNTPPYLPASFLQHAELRCRGCRQRCTLRKGVQCISVKRRREGRHQAAEAPSRCQRTKGRKRGEVAVVLCIVEHSCCCHLSLSLSLSLAPFSQTLVVDLSTIAPHVSGPNSVKVTHSLKSIAAQRKQVDKVRGNHAHNN